MVHDQFQATTCRTMEVFILTAIIGGSQFFLHVKLVRLDDLPAIEEWIDGKAPVLVDETELHDAPTQLGIEQGKPSPMTPLRWIPRTEAFPPKPSVYILRKNMVFMLFMK